jgi:hypothetical protein
VNAAQLQQWAQQNRKPLLITGAAVAGGLGLLTARKGKTAGDPPLAETGMTANGATLTGTVPAYNSSSSDLYNAIQPQLENLQSIFDATKSPIPVAPPPIASTIFAPTKTGKYLHNQYGGYLEVQNDGSLFALKHEDVLGLGLTPDKATRVRAEDLPAYYNLADNLAGSAYGRTPERVIASKDQAGKLIRYDSAAAAVTRAV